VVQKNGCKKLRRGGKTLGVLGGGGVGDGERKVSLVMDVERMGTWMNR